MKNLKIITTLVCLFLINTTTWAQRGKGHKHGHHHAHKVHGNKKVVVVHRSPYRPHKVKVFYPAWRPKYAYNRRWVYFPKYNLYWDNWRNHYRFWNGTIWVTQTAPPPVIVNVNLETEKSYELKESDDDNDDINSENDDHKKEYKTD